MVRLNRRRSPVVPNVRCPICGAELWSFKGQYRHEGGIEIADACTMLREIHGFPRGVNHTLDLFKHGCTCHTIPDGWVPQTAAIAEAPSND